MSRCAAVYRAIFVPILSVNLLLAGLESPALANQLSLPTIVLTRESSGPLVLDFLPSPEPIVALQFDLDYDPAAIELIATAGDAARKGGKLLYSLPLSPTRTRFLIFGWNQTALLAGPLVQFLAGTFATAEIRAYDLRISNAAATFPNGVSAPISATGGSIAVIPGNAERLSAAGVVNAASLAAGPIAPGELATLFGRGIGPALATLPESGPSSASLGGVSVWVDGIPAPMLYAGPNQINAVIPMGISGDSTSIVVSDGGQIRAEVSVATAATAPAVFTMNASGVGPSAILNEDSSMNSPENPARRGAAISIYGTGSGRQLDPQDPLLPVSVQIGGKDAEILYAGAAPGLITGMLQIVCVIPAEVVEGSAVEILIIVGGETSPRGTTLAIQGVQP